MQNNGIKPIAEDIRYSIFKRMYEQAKYLLVPEFIIEDINNIDINADPPMTLTANSDLLRPRRFMTDTEIDALPLNAPQKDMKRKERNIAFKEYETEILPNVLPPTPNPPYGSDYPNNERILKAIYIDENSDNDDTYDRAFLTITIGEEPSGLDLIGELIEKTAQENRTVPLGQEEGTACFKFILDVTSAEDEDRYNEIGLDIILHKTSTGRILHIWNQLRQVMDPFYFAILTQKLPQYSITTRVKETQLSKCKMEHKEFDETTVSLEFKATFTQQITR